MLGFASRSSVTGQHERIAEMSIHRPNIRCVRGSAEHPGICPRCSLNARSIVLSGTVLPALAGPRGSQAVGRQGRREMCAPVVHEMAR